MLASHFTIIKDSWSFLARKPLLYLHQPHNRQDFNLIKKKKKSARKIISPIIYLNDVIYELYNIVLEHVFFNPITMLKMGVSQEL